MHALNEELQATNEELETINEELEATVEELRTTNEDLLKRARARRPVADHTKSLRGQRISAQGEKATHPDLPARSGKNKQTAQPVPAPKPTAIDQTEETPE